MNTDLMDTLRSGGYSLVARQGGRIYTFRQRGVADLFDLYTGRPPSWLAPTWRIRWWAGAPPR